MSDIDRLLRSFRAIVREMFPKLDYLGCYEYRVAAGGSGPFDLQPASEALGLPNLAKVPIRPGLAGSKSELANGTSVLVSFVNGDPARPFVSWVAGEADSGFEPDGDTDIDAGGTLVLQGGVLGAARMADTIQAGPFNGTITSASTKVKVG